MLDVDPVGMVRGRAGSDRKGGGLEDQYVNDRAYVASSLLSVVIARWFGAALGGRCEKRPDLAAQQMPGGLVAIQNLPKQQEIAIMINTSRETVSRAIAHLVATGVLEKDFRRLIVRDPNRLRRLASQQPAGVTVKIVSPASR